MVKKNRSATRTPSPVGLKTDGLNSGFVRVAAGCFPGCVRPGTSTIRAGVGLADWLDGRLLPGSSMALHGLGKDIVVSGNLFHLDRFYLTSPDN